MSYIVENEVFIGENAELELAANRLLGDHGFYSTKMVDTLSIDEVSQDDLESATFVGANLDSDIDPYKRAEIADLAFRVRNIIETLNERQQIILRRRFKVDGSKEDFLETIGKELPVPITRERVRQIQAKTFIKLRNKRMNGSILIYGTDYDFGEYLTIRDRMRVHFNGVVNACYQGDFSRALDNLKLAKKMGRGDKRLLPEVQRFDLMVLKRFGSDLEDITSPPPIAEAGLSSQNTHPLLETIRGLERIIILVLLIGGGLSIDQFVNGGIEYKSSNNSGYNLRFSGMKGLGIEVDLTTMYPTDYHKPIYAGDEKPLVYPQPASINHIVLSLDDGITSGDTVKILYTR